MAKPRPNVVTTTFDEHTRKRIETCVQKYHKRDKALVVYEIVSTYIGMYEEAENARLETLVEQGARGKVQAPSTLTGRRARKSA
jgi:hypothetical protein